MLLCLTANQHNASFATLEKLSLHSAQAGSMLVSASEVGGAVILATCNRFEAYLDVADDAADPARTALRLLSTSSELTESTLDDALNVLSGQHVVEHLFAVTTGLESVIVGEDEISGQVRRALERARTAGTTSSRLELLFQNASRTARGVRTSTPIGGAGRSLVRLALELASSRVPDWTRQRVLVVGTGQYAGTSVAALRARGVNDIAVFSPSGRGAAFALRHGLDLAQSLHAGFAAADLVITCTSTDTPVITHDTARSARDGSYRLVVDLGLPRNVDPEVAEVDGVELLDLETVQLHAPLDELNATDDARSLVGLAAAEFSALEAEHSVSPAIVALRTHAFAALEEEIARVRASGDTDGRTEAALRHLTGVLLHTPSARAHALAREGRAQEFADGLAAVFDIRVGLQAGTTSNSAAASA